MCKLMPWHSWTDWTQWKCTEYREVQIRQCKRCGYVEELSLKHRISQIDKKTTIKNEIHNNTDSTA